jgi:hypothetical protein
MRGQMFILTMVFLVGLIFSVQTLLLSYSYVDLSRLSQDSDANIMNVLVSAIQDTVERTEICDEVEGNLDELSRVIGTGMLAAYDIDISYDIFCGRWQNQPPGLPPVVADIRITGEKTETEAEFSFYHNVTG